MSKILLIFFMMAFALKADVKSTTGEIKFDVLNDSNTEMILNQTGLGIGVTPASNLHVNGNVIISDQLMVGGSSGSSNLHISGTLGYGFETVSSNTTLSNQSIILADSSSDNITLTLPYAGNVNGRQYQIKKTSALNSVWVLGGGNLIDDVGILELPESSDLPSVKLISDGSQWYKIEQKDTSETIASDNLIAWWKLDEASGNIATDSSSSNYDGVYTGYDASAGVDEGVIVSGTNITSGRNIIIDQIGDDLSGSDVISISFWVKTSSSVTSWRNPFSFSEAGVDDFRFAVGSPTTDLHIYYAGLFTSLKVTDSLTPEVWHHVACTADGTNFVTYFNGVSTNEGPLVGTLNSSGNLYIGSRYPSVGYYEGVIDDVRIYDRALSSAEVKAIHSLLQD